MAIHIRRLRCVHSKIRHIPSSSICRITAKNGVVQHDVEQPHNYIYSLCNPLLVCLFHLIPYYIHTLIRTHLFPLSLFLHPSRTHTLLLMILILLRLRHHLTKVKLVWMVFYLYWIMLKSIPNVLLFVRLLLILFCLKLKHYWTNSKENTILLCFHLWSSIKPIWTLLSCLKHTKLLLKIARRSLAKSWFYPWHKYSYRWYFQKIGYRLKKNIYLCLMNYFWLLFAGVIIVLFIVLMTALLLWIYSKYIRK